MTTVDYWNIEVKWMTHHVNLRLMQPDNQGGKSISILSMVVFLETSSRRCVMNCFIAGYWVNSALALPWCIFHVKRSLRTSAPVIFSTCIVLFCANAILLRRSGFRAYNEEKSSVKHEEWDTNTEMFQTGTLWKCGDETYLDELLFFRDTCKHWNVTTK